MAVDDADGRAGLLGGGIDAAVGLEVATDECFAEGVVGPLPGLPAGGLPGVLEGPGEGDEAFARGSWRGGGAIPEHSRGW